MIKLNKFFVLLLVLFAASPALGQSPPSSLAKDARIFQKSLDKVEGSPFDFERAAKGIKARSASAIFEWVKENIEYEPYNGSLRGAVGTLIDRKGNSVDQSLLLVELFRYRGLNARLARAHKTPADIQTLLAEFAGNATLINPASISAKTPATTNPTQNPRYASLITDHVWAEVEVKGNWIAADPILADHLGANGLQATSREATLWDDLRAKVSIQVIVTLEDGQEKKLADWDGELSQVQEGVRLTFNPHPRLKTALIPTFEIGDQTSNGDYFPADQVTNMVAKVRIRRGMLESRFEEVLANKADKVPVFSYDQAYFSFSFFNTYGSPALARYVTTSALVSASDAMQSWVSVVDSSAGGEAPDARPYLNRIHDRLPHAIAVSYITHFDTLMNELAFGLGVRTLLVEPRFVTTALLRKGDAYSVRMNVRDSGLDAMPRKGVPEAAAAGFLTMAGRIEAQLEGKILAQASGEDLFTVDDLFAAAEKSRVPVMTVDARSITKLNGNGADISSIREVIRRRGNVVLMTSRPVDVEGTSITGYWALNPETGRISGSTGGGLISALKPLAEGEQEGPVGKAAFVLMKRLLVLSDTTEDTRAHLGNVCSSRADLVKISGAFCATTAPLELPKASDCLTDKILTGFEVASAGSCEVRTQTMRCGVAVSSALLTGELTALYSSGDDPMDVSKTAKKSAAKKSRAFGLTCK
jgi:hypothetical protein